MDNQPHKELYNELTGHTEDTEERFDVDNKIIDLVIFRCHEIIGPVDGEEIANEFAEVINSLDSDEQIRWLLSDGGMSTQEIKDFIGKTGF